jgi:hypothetical protein
MWHKRQGYVTQAIRICDTSNKLLPYFSRVYFKNQINEEWILELSTDCKITQSEGGACVHVWQRPAMTAANLCQKTRSALLNNSLFVERKKSITLESKIIACNYRSTTGNTTCRHFKRRYLQQKHHSYYYHHHHHHHHYLCRVFVIMFPKGTVFIGLKSCNCPVAAIYGTCNAISCHKRFCVFI